MGKLPTIAGLQAENETLRQNVAANKVEADNNNARRYRAETERDAACKELAETRETLQAHRQDVARMRGMLEMLERLGTIPKAEPEGIPSMENYARALGRGY